MENNMKKILTSLVVVLLFSCGAKKNTANPETVALLSECKKNANCTVKLLQHKSMVVKQDEFGSQYYTLEENPEKNVIVYTYSITGKGDVQDASYREEIVFEIGHALANLKLVDSDIQSSKMLFGRFCYCKGQTGYYKVTHGKMDIDQDSKLSLDFTVTEVPQIIKRIQLSIK